MFVIFHRQQLDEAKLQQLEFHKKINDLHSEIETYSVYKTESISKQKIIEQQEVVMDKLHQQVSILAQSQAETEIQKQREAVCPFVCTLQYITIATRCRNCIPQSQRHYQRITANHCRKGIKNSRTHTTACAI